jgi:hypothetical protein
VAASAKFSLTVNPDAVSFPPEIRIAPALTVNELALLLTKVVSCISMLLPYMTAIAPADEPSFDRKLEDTTLATDRSETYTGAMGADLYPPVGSVLSITEQEFSRSSDELVAAIVASPTFASNEQRVASINEDWLSMAALDSTAAPASVTASFPIRLTASLS